MPQQHNSIIVGRVSQGKTTNVAELEACMRRQPGHIATGEVRGEEAPELLKAWSAGGSASTASARTLALFDLPEIHVAPGNGCA